jgi:hypothetical protein
MMFIERGFFHDERRSLIVSEKLLSFYFHRVVMEFIEGELFHDERSNLTVYESLFVDFICMES